MDADEVDAVLGDPPPTDSADPDDADASSGACGCILAAVALIVIVGTLYACAARGPESSSCEAAWDGAARSDAAMVQAEPYRATLTACSTVAEWDEENLARGARLAPGAASIAELCRALDVTSALCTTAEREAP